MTRQQAARLVAAISAAHPRTKVPDETVAVYAKLLEDIPYPVGEEAVTTVLREVAFWPSVAEIRDECRRIQQRIRDQRPGLPQPDVSPQQRAENLERIKELAGTFGRRMP